jgi:hypothetical protein
MITPETVRTALYDVWGAQSCQFARDWPDSFKRFMAASNETRTSLKPRFEQAVVTLAERYRDGAPPEAAALALIHAAFAHLDPEHRALLHRALAALVEQTAPMAEAAAAVEITPATAA